MKKLIIIAVSLLIILAVLFGFWSARHSQNREVATELLELHHQWAMNGYNPPPGKDMPSIPAEHGHADAATFSPLGGYLQYDYQTNGVTWFGRFEISRPDTNTTTWTVYESGFPVDTNLSQLAWQHQLITMTVP
jgi:hypothetical protein